MRLLWPIVLVLLFGCESNDVKRDPKLIYDLRGYIRPDNIKYPVGKTITVKYWLTNVSKKDIDEQITMGSKNAKQPFQGYSFNALSTEEEPKPLELQEAGKPYNGKLSLSPKEEKVFVQNKFIGTKPGPYLLSFRLHWRNSKRIPFKPVTVYITKEQKVASALSPEIEKALATLTSKDNIERGKAKELILSQSDVTAPVLVSYLGKADPILRSEAISLLTTMVGKSSLQNEISMKRFAKEALLKGMEDKNRDIRLRSIIILKSIAGKEYFIALHRVIKQDKDREIRMTALQCFVKIFAEERSVPILALTLEDHDITIRKYAVSTLRKLTKQNFGFDPQGEKEERKGAFLRWLRWCKRKYPNAFR